MPSHSQSVRPNTPVDDCENVHQPRHYIGPHYLPPQPHHRPDPKWLPYVEANRTDIIDLSSTVHRHDEQFDDANEDIRTLGQGFDAVERGLQSLLRQLNLQHEDIEQQQETLGHVKEALDSLSEVQEAAEAHMAESNAVLGKASERLTKVEEWFQSLWYKVERMDTNDDDFRADMRKSIDEIKERFRTNRKHLEEKMRMMEREMRQMKTENEDLFASHKSEIDALKHQMISMREDFDQFKAILMHDSEESVVIVSREISDEVE